MTLVRSTVSALELGQTLANTFHRGVPAGGASCGWSTSLSERRRREATSPFNSFVPRTRVILRVYANRCCSFHVVRAEFGADVSSFLPNGCNCGLVRRVCSFLLILGLLDAIQRGHRHRIIFRRHWGRRVEGNGFKMQSASFRGA